MEKSRIDVIDTHLQHAQEWRILRFLTFVLMVTILYEVGIPWESAVVPGEESALSAEARRVALPWKRLEILREHVREALAEHPEFLTAGRSFPSRLERLTERSRETPRDRTLLPEIGLLLEELWRFTHQPVWESDKPFAPINGELETIFRLIKRKIPEEMHIPALHFVPFLVDDIRPPKRDIFAFGAPEGGTP